MPFLSDNREIPDVAWTMTMRIPLTLTQTYENTPHIYHVYGLDGDYSWLSHLAEQYHNLRVETDHPLEEISIDGIAVVNPTSILERIRSATIPTRPPKPTNFDVVRSDFGETLCYVLLEDAYQTIFGYKSVRDRELIQQPGRGIDAVGIEENLDGTLTLVLAEVKVSDDGASPPRVVDASDDSLRNQHIEHIQHLEKTVKKLYNTCRHSRKPEVQKLFIRAAICLEDGKMDQICLVACCLLVRPQAKYAETDFGTFRNSPVDFDPAKVRFLVVCIPENVDTVITKWYDQLQHLSE